MLIPFMSITYRVEKEVSEKLIFIESQGEAMTPIVAEQSIFTFENIIYGVYILVTTILLLRFLISLNALRKEIASGKKIKKGNYTLVLQEEKATAHSFWNYIFLNRNDFENGKIDEKIIRHEELHLKQKHSFDVVLIEFLLTVFWFNPAFYFYKKAMLTNHEFLADEHVLKYDGNIRSYQQLLLTELISEKILFTNQFNLSNTKKRIKMMTTPNNKKSKFYSWLTLPLAAGLFFVFVEKVPAQKEENSSKNVKGGHEVPQAKIKNFEKELNKSVENGTILSANADTLKPKQSADRSIPPPPPKEEMDSEKSSVAENPPPPPPPPLSLNPKEEKSLREAQSEVDKLPMYPGGINSMRAKVGNNFDVSKMKGNEGLLKAAVYFVIDENGNTSNFTAEGENSIFNKEALLATKAANTTVKWEPALKDGKPVRYRFKLPITMSFETFDKK